MVVGDRGRLVLPADVRDRAKLPTGTALTVVETDRGIILMTRDQLRSWVRQDLEGLDLVNELIAERRDAAAGDAA